MKNTIKLILLIIVTNVIFISYSQKLNLRDKCKIRKTLRVMVKDDQKFRGGKNKSIFLIDDSLKMAQTRLDEQNRLKFIQLVNQYGYPSFDRVRNELALLLLLHFTYEKDFNLLFELLTKERLKGNLPPNEFAIWYDRCAINRGEKPYYGAYGMNRYSEHNWELINTHRSEIGLAPIYK